MALVDKEMYNILLQPQQKVAPVEAKELLPVEELVQAVAQEEVDTLAKNMSQSNMSLPINMKNQVTKAQVKAQ